MNTGVYHTSVVALWGQGGGGRCGKWYGRTWPQIKKGGKTNILNKNDFWLLTDLKLLSKIKTNKLLQFLKFIMSVRGGHCF
jgi:hypothetical protein